ncbi:MAG: hypothetical protein JSV08_06665 [Acidobacteriota bacterium]|nr:MAG: hypothetical protein JSV08_06665 [Acidobacteriota bacterium]
MLSYLSPHWLGLTLTALVLYGLAQGFMRLYIEDVPPARFCLYALATDAVVNISFILYQHLAHTEPWPFAP